MTNGIFWLPTTWAAALVLGLTASVIAAYGVRTMVAGRSRDQRVERVGGTVLLGRWLVEAFYWAFSLPGQMFVRLGVSPDTLTWTSLVVVSLSGPAAALGHFSLAGALLLFGAAFDMLDGYVARMRNLGSERGEVLDSVLDRYADAAPLLGLAIFYRADALQLLLPLLALVGFLLLSYVRAKAEGKRLALPNTVMRRHERTTYLVIALVVGPELSRWLGTPWGIVHPVTLGLLAMMALLSNFAAFQLLFLARRELQRQGRGIRRPTA